MKRMKDPDRAGVKRNVQSALPIRMTMGSAPAGGWVVFVSCITAMEVATANPRIYHSLPRKVRKRSPINEETRCPPIKFLGWDNGLSGTPNKRTQEAPNGAIIKG